MRILVTVLAVLVLALVGVLLYLAANLNGLVKDGIEREAPRYLGAAVQVATVDLSPWTGAGEISGLTVANPQGFPAGDALRLGRVRVALDTASLGEPVLVLRDVVLDGAEVLLDQQGRSTNVQQLLRNLEQASAGRAKADGGSTIKVVVDQLTFTNGTATVRSDVLGERTLKIPDLALSGLGREGEGATPAEILEQVLAPVLRALSQELTRSGLQAGKDKAAELLQQQLDQRLGADKGAAAMDALKKLNPFGRSSNNGNAGG